MRARSRFMRSRIVTPSRFVTAVGVAGLAVTLTIANSARAFCGFYVAPTDEPLYADASVVLLARGAGRTALVMSNNYRGPAADFAMVVPVPVVVRQEDVKTLPHGLLDRLERTSAPRLVEYWEQDPCLMTEEQRRIGKTSVPLARPPDDQYGVTVERQFSVDEYDVVVLGAAESDGLERWLVDHHYKLPKGASAALAPYIKEQQKFLVAKVDVGRVKRDGAGVAVLSPLRVDYDSNDFRLPVRLGLLNAPPGPQDLIVYILAANRRYEVANYPNVLIPTNVDVRDETRHSFASFYAALFDATLARAGGRAVVTEYAWDIASCDPCVTPPLRREEVMALGVDAILELKTQADEIIRSRPRPGDPPPSRRRKALGDDIAGMVLTRLHARYDATTLPEDLVFRAAEPVTGGREVMHDGEVEHAVTGSPVNAFQARYVIRHAWTGPIACLKPVRGVWGPPWDGITHGVQVATGLARAPRGGIELAAFAVSRIPELELKKDAPPAGAPPTQGGRGLLRWVGWGLAALMIAIVAGLAWLAIRSRRISQ